MTRCCTEYAFSISCGVVMRAIYVAWSRDFRGNMIADRWRTGFGALLLGLLSRGVHGVYVADF